MTANLQTSFLINPIDFSPSPSSIFTPAEVHMSALVSARPFLCQPFFLFGVNRRIWEEAAEPLNRKQVPPANSNVVWLQPACTSSDEFNVQYKTIITLSPLSTFPIASSIARWSMSTNPCCYDSGNLFISGSEKISATCFFNLSY